MMPQANALAAHADVMVDTDAAESLYRRGEQLHTDQVAWMVLDQPLDT